MRYYFQWDYSKAESNLRKHKISFKQAAEVFRDPRAISTFDEAHSVDEERWITIGSTSSDVLLVVVHTFVEETTSQCTLRLISARQATRKEKQHYEEQR